MLEIESRKTRQCSGLKTEKHAADVSGIWCKRLLPVMVCLALSHAPFVLADDNGNVKVSTNEQLKFEYLPTAKRYFGLNPNNLSFEKGSKVSRKQLEAKGFSKKFCHEISRRQFFNFLNQLPSRLGKMFSF